MTDPEFRDTEDDPVEVVPASVNNGGKRSGDGAPINLFENVEFIDGGDGFDEEMPSTPFAKGCGINLFANAELVKTEPDEDLWAEEDE